MDTYAVVEIKGKQFKVWPGAKVETPLIDSKEGTKINIERVLLVKEGADIKLGKPYLSDFKISAEVISHPKGPKIKVSKYKAKSRYQKETGFRAKLSLLKIAEFGQPQTPRVTETSKKPVSQKAKKTSKA